MKTFSLTFRHVAILCLLITSSFKAWSQRIYASSQDNGASGLLCVNCSVTNPANAADGNIETYSVLNVTVGIASETYQDLIFPSKVASGTPVTVKLGSGDKLLSLTALGGVLLQAYNGSSPVGQPIAVSTLLTVLSNNNEVEVSLTPNAQYDRLRVVLNGGLVGALSYIYLYEAFYNGTAAGACNSPIDELHGISAGLLGLGADIGGVVNPQYAIDGNLNTASTLNAGVGLVGAYAQQMIIYEAPSVKGDSIRMTLSIPDALIQAGILNNISVATYNGTNGAPETYLLSSNLLQIRLLDDVSGTRKFTVTWAPVNVFDRVQLTLGGIANVLSTLNLYEAQKLIPRPVIKFNGVVTNSASVCNGSAATLTATAVSNTTFLWYASQTAATPLYTGTSFTTPALTTTTTYYVAAMRTGCTDQSERTALTVTVNNIPANPVIAKNAVTVCPGQPASFTATAVTGVTVNWYTTTTGGTAVATGNTFTTGALTQTTNYYAEATAGGTCVSPGRTEVTATVSPLPAAPTLTAANVNICSGNVAVLSVASPVTGVTYNWYGSATGGTSLNTGSTFTTPALTSNAIYYVEADNATGCPSSARAQATVTITPNPADPTLAANNSSISAGQTATINVTNAQTGITYNWYTSATAASSVYTGTSYTTPALYTNTTYYISAVNATGCQSADRTAIAITVTINNNTPCSFANQQTSSVNGICIGCSVTNGALATDADTTTASTIYVLAGLVGGSAQQQLTFQQPGYAGDTVKIVVGTPVSLLSASVLSDINIALYNGTTLVENYVANNALIKIQLLGSGSNRYAIYIPAKGNYTSAVITLNSGVATLLTALQVYYAVQEYPTPVLSPANSEICKGSATKISITTPDAGTYQWYTAPTGGTVAYTGTSFTTPALTANTTYYIAYTRGTCSAPVRYPVQVLVDSQPANPVVDPSSETIVSGKTATFTATVPVNVTVNWYTAATGGTPVYTGTTFTTPGLTANTTYYAEAASGSCVSPGRTTATVIVTANVVPSVAVTPPTQIVNPGTTATLTASSTTAGTTFNWYTTPTGGTPIYTGATFVTPPVFASTTYYASATVTATGTVSASRASGVVNVSTSTTSPTPCDAAIDQTSTTSGLLCVLCAVNNPTGATDADRNTFSQLDVPVGLVGGYAQQTLRFANAGQAGDTIVVELGIPATLASVSVLSQISLATYNGTTYNNDMFSLNTSLINITLLNGTTRFRYAFVATHSFDRVQIRLNSGVAGVLNALNIYDAYQEVASPVVAASTVTACQGTQATLTATVPSYETVRWYTTASGGTPVFTGSVFNTPALNASTTYYAEASRTADGCGQSVRTPVNVTVTPVPVAPVVAAATQTVCSGSPATFTATAVTGVTFSWYTSSTGGTPVFTGNPFITPALTASTSYYVEANGAGQCGSSARIMVTANVTSTPLTPTIAQSTVQTCSGSSAVLTATSTQSGVTFNWYTSATGGTAVYTGAQYTTPALTANTTYYVEAEAGSCSSPSRAEAKVTVNPTPAQPTVTVNPSNAQVTSGQTATLSAASTTSGAIFNWYTTATGGTPVFTGATFTTPALTSNTTYYVAAELVATGCTSPQRTAVNIAVNPIFSTSCDFASSETTSTSGVCAGCSVITPNNSVNNDTTDYAQLNMPLTVLTGSVSQNLNFSDGGIVGDTVKIRLRIPGTLLSAAVLSHIQITSYNGATSNNDSEFLNSTLISVQLLSSNNDVLVKFVPKAAYNSVQVSLVNSGVALFNLVDIFYATKEVEQAQLTATTENICSGSTATFKVSNARTGVTYQWYSAATGGTLLYTGTTYTTPDLTTTTTYYVQTSRTANLCPNPNRVAATANVTPSPVTPVLAQSSIQVCAGDAVTLSVTNAGTGTVQWYNAATGGTLLFTGANYQVSPVANIVYYAQILNGSCSSITRATATITVNPTPSQPGVQSNNITVCLGSPATITVLSPQAAVTYKFYTTATGGTAVYTGTSYTTPAITQNTIYYIEASGNTGGCINNGGRTQVSVNVTNQITGPTLSATQTQVCGGGSITIGVDNPVSGYSYNWYTAATGGTLVFTGTTFTQNNVTANVSYYVEALNGLGCTSSTRTETDIVVTPVPTPPTVQTAVGGLSVCMGSSASLSIVNPQANYVYNWYNAPGGGTLLYTGTQFNTPPLTNTTTYYVEAAGAGNCNASAPATVTVTVNSLPADPALVNNNVSVCSGSTATLQVQSPQSGITYQWYDSPAMTNLLFTGTTFITPPITGTTDYYLSATNASGCSSNNTAQAQVNIQPAPPAPALSNADTVQTCTGTKATLSIANPQAGYTYNWYTSASGGSSVYTGTDFETPALTASTTYYAEATNVTGCASETRTSVYINVPATPSAPLISSTGTSICPGLSTTLTASSPAPGITISWYAAATGGTALATGNSFTTPVLNSTTTYYAAASNSLGCAPSARTPVTVTILQPLDAPVVAVASTTTSSITFAWAAVAGATGYQVSFDNGVTFSAITTALADTVTGLQPAQAVTIFVRAEGASTCEQSANSAAVTGRAQNPQGDAIFVPNAFTPNGDGKNDVEYVYGNTIQALKFYVYDQWGEMLFQSNSKNYGWDGTFKGNKQPVGVYVYYLEATMSDGTRVKKKGTITLLR